jgi:tetratricopeptide (TPR) repeat protein
MHANAVSSCLRILRFVLPVGYLLLYSVAAMADAKGDYDQGVAYFKKGDYQAAIASFESARKQGMESEALFYNLGSAYYKTGQYSESGKYFTRVTEYPDKRALAEFNLGMIALKQNDNEQALVHFRYAEANSPSPKIVDASRQNIAILTGTARRWGALLTAKFGYDDNISVTPDNVAVGVDDTFYSVYASADVIVHGERKKGWLLDAAYFTVDYSDSDNFDQDFYTVGVRNEHRFTRWDTIAHLKYGSSTFGGDDLQSFYKLDVLGVTPLARNQRIILQYRFDDFTSENTLYDYLEGWRQRAQVRYYRNTATSNQQLYYEGELNNRGEFVTSTVSYEYSPTRHMLGGRYTHRFTDKWYLSGDLSYRTSDFPASATLDRDDDRWLLDVFLDYRIGSSLQLKGNVKYIDNVSTVDIYTYDRTVVSLGLSLQF